jgi:hypothetical protein
MLTSLTDLENIYDRGGKALNQSVASAKTKSAQAFRYLISEQISNVSVTAYLNHNGYVQYSDRPHIPEVEYKASCGHANILS